MSEGDGRFVSSFMDDYFAEADEHVVTVRRGLLALERALGRELPRLVVEELFRACHSLKGISAMVDLHEVEALAHHMESGLRALRQGELELTPAAFEALLAGARGLEAALGARRQGGEAAGTVAPAIAALQGVVPRATGTADAARSEETALRTWTVTFVPSPDLTARGIKVDTVRARLLQVGAIVQVAPRVLPDGGISFDFEVRTDDEASLAAMAGDGISYVPSAAAEGPAQAAASTGEPAARALEGAAAPPGNFVRVDLARLEDLMRLVGDLVVTRARLDDTLRRVERFVPAQEFRTLQEHEGLLERQLRDLREGIMRVRLVPVGEIFRRMPFVVRDLARDHGKQVRLEMAGQGTEIDKFLIERMMDPVLHLVRNAISHGIEPPPERAAAGKPAEGTIRLNAATAGESVVLQIGDDGRGIDRAAVAARARALGIPVGDGPVDRRRLLDILCTSGFSTREEADRASGRGVGMAVVRDAVRELGGTLTLESEEGAGTTFTLTLPLTLAITDAIIAQVGPQTFAVPQSTVREVIEVDPAAIRILQGHELVTHREAALPLVRLARLFGLESAPRARAHVIVAGAGAAAVGLLVDRITGQREIVVKTITDPLIRVDGVSGATELGDGRLVLILDLASLGRRVRERAREHGVPA